MFKSINNSCITVGDKVWISYDSTPGQSQCGDYGYLQAYAKNRVECTYHGLAYIRGVVIAIMWQYDSIQFNIHPMDIAGKQIPYTIFIKDVNRMYLPLDESD